MGISFVRNVCVFVLYFVVCREGISADFPKLTQGLWQITTTASNAPAHPYKTSICINQDTQQDMLKISMGLLYKKCARNELRMEDKKAVSDAVCKIYESKATIRGITTFTGTTKYQSEVLIVYEPSSQFGEKERKVINYAEYAGACKYGQKAGDMIFADGTARTIRAILDAQQ